MRSSEATPTGLELDLWIVAIGIVRSDTARTAKGIVGDMCGFRALEASRTIGPLAHARPKPGLSERGG